MDIQLEQLVEEYLSLDQNQVTRKAILDLVANKNYKELERLLGSRLTFGTAGLVSI
jgi:hypothetical protein